MGRWERGDLLREVSTEARLFFSLHHSSASTSNKRRAGLGYAAFQRLVTGSLGRKSCLPYGSLGRALVGWWQGAELSLSLYIYIYTHINIYLSHTHLAVSTAVPPKQAASESSASSAYCSTCKPAADSEKTTGRRKKEVAAGGGNAKQHRFAPGTTVTIRESTIKPILSPTCAGRSNAFPSTRSNRSRWLQAANSSSSSTGRQRMKYTHNSKGTPPHERAQRDRAPQDTRPRVLRWGSSALGQHGGAPAPLLLRSRTAALKRPLISGRPVSPAISAIFAGGADKGGASFCCAPVGEAVNATDGVGGRQEIKGRASSYRVKRSQGAAAASAKQNNAIEERRYRRKAHERHAPRVRRDG